MIHCVTTMNKAYYSGIGQIMIETWKDFFPKKGFKLHLYLEDFQLEIDDDRIIIEDWNTVDELYRSWGEKQKGANDRSKKFTKKALSQIAIWRKLKSGKLLWLDADIVFLDFVPSDFFENTLENYPLASWGYTQFESGTVFINLSHPEFDNIKKEYEKIYIDDRTLPKGQRWFDGELLGYACMQAGGKHKDLNSLCTAKSNTPLNRSPLGKFMQHFKAKRKKNLKDDLSGWINRPDLAKKIK